MFFILRVKKPETISFYWDWCVLWLHAFFVVIQTTSFK